MKESVLDLLYRGKERTALRLSSCVAADQVTVEVEIEVVYAIDNGESLQNGAFGFYDNYFDQKNKFKGLKAVITFDCSGEVSWELVVENNGNITLESANAAINTLEPIHKFLNKKKAKHVGELKYQDFIVHFSKSVKARSFFTRDGEYTAWDRNDDIRSIVHYVEKLVPRNSTTKTLKRNN